MEWLAYTVFYTPLRSANSTFKKLNIREMIHQFRGKRINTYLAGEGSPVLFVHGWEMSTARYEPLMSAIVDAGFSVASCDLPAHGKSKGISSDIVEIGEVMQKLSGFVSCCGDT